MNAIPFGPWLRPADVAESVPDSPAVVQVRVRDGLVDYPAGRSAMVWYGAGAAHAVAAALARRRDAGDLLVRFRPSPEPGPEADDLLARFRSRFGTLPRDNEAEG